MDTTDVGPSTKERKKSRKSKGNHADVQNDDHTEQPVVVTKEKKPKKTKSAVDTQPEDVITEKSKRARHVEGVDRSESVVEGTTSKKSLRKEEKLVESKSEEHRVEDGKVKKSKRKHTATLSGQAETTAHGQETTASDSEKKKKRKEKQSMQTKDKGSVDTAESTSDIKKRVKKRKKDTTVQDIHIVEEPPKKKRKNRDLPYPDPEDDKLLTDQAIKALSYAYAQFQDPTIWKFSKARQNWLIRNVWSEEAIPQKYMPLLNQYFVGMKGGVKENFLKTCQSILSPPAKPQAPENINPPADGDSAAGKLSANPAAETTPTPGIKESRARTILEALSAS